MEPNILDLREERCPMALLLAKRRAILLQEGESLSIQISDTSSMQDIVSFLRLKQFDIVSVAHRSSYTITVLKQG
ncbi:sulfurtransferase TusA family protein [Vibrio genomosp. F6]|uniref:sulfurtransferase TusA family protein n=1 Tax=Vibrio genomosp. F6 TaxID=723172 RepID=UPI0010BD1AB6|nr:sulfurtransferase TusA family protein [Vibrio genomosp. F6]TKF20480.1 sulfurtransferase TusA family protein [Vibrio genomosp. F6]